MFFFIFILLSLCLLLVRGPKGTLGVFSGIHGEQVDVSYCSNVSAITVELQWDVQPSFLGVSDSQECFSPYLCAQGAF